MATERNLKQHPSHWLFAGILLFGLGAIAGLSGLVVTAIRKVQAGHGLDSFHTTWLVEFNWIGVLVLLGGVAVALLIAAAFWVRDYLEWRAFERKYGRRRHGRA